MGMRRKEIVLEFNRYVLWPVLVGKALKITDAKLRDTTSTVQFNLTHNSKKICWRATRLKSVYPWWNMTDICREEKHENYKLRRPLLGYQLEPYSSAWRQPAGAITNLRDNCDSH